MPPQVAALLCFGFIAWLFARDARRRSGVSSAIYIPLLWAFVVGTRPLSMYPFSPSLGLGSGEINAGGSAEGSPFDTLLFMGSILFGAIVVLRRRLNFQEIFRTNRALGIYFVYLGISVLWADSSFVSLKRWIKDLGNVIMVLIILSEAEPLSAVKAFLARFAYMVLPLSVLVIKYFGDISRYYDEWTYQPRYCGMSTDKNMLGMSLFVSMVSIVWLLIQTRERPPGTKKDKLEVPTYGVLIVLGIWLLSKAQSATAMTCTGLGSVIMLGLRVPFVRARLDRLGVFATVAVVVVLILQFTLDISNVFVGFLGRDLTFTGRTDIWAAVLKTDINPLIGTGFYSFWSDERMRMISDGYNGLINESHNGYLETYLNSGMIGVGLLIFMLAATAKAIKRSVAAGDPFGGLRFSFLLASVVYAFSEAIFNRLSGLWVMLLLAAIDLPRRQPASVPAAAGSAQRNPEPPLDTVQPPAGSVGAGAQV
jgi:O-antigen ligase